VGVDYAQGFCVGRPKPLDRLLITDAESETASEPLEPTV
jgi:hypothetical protein